ncbi:lipase 3-like isoform X1 [Drosophila bipectinata]|uniref:lipase 3-like isoform X1 n=1 Tax=Drosophila bipectinata TaxID=42026 RepID=UPI0038B3AD17
MARKFVKKMLSKKVGVCNFILIIFTNLFGLFHADTAEFIERHKYPVEFHNVVTEDGYILGVFRIPNSPHNTGTFNVTRPVFLLQHGILMSSDCWVITDPRHGLPFLLADAGFDVWMINSRGNRYSRRHQHLDPDGTQFWQFSFHEMGNHDLPDTIDFILRHTNQAGLHFVGHSQGATAFLVMLSLRPEYGEKIFSSHLLAPVAFQRHSSSWLARNLLENALQLPDIEIPAIHPSLQEVVHSVCAISWIREICKYILFFFAGGESKHLDEMLVPRIMSIVLAGISSRQIRHFASNIKYDRFALLDFGDQENLRIYGSLQPPDYPLGSIRTLKPINLYFGGKDKWLDVKDSRKLIRILPESNLNVMPTWNHVDFIFGDKGNACLNELIIRNTKKSI